MGALWSSSSQLPGVSSSSFLLTVWGLAPSRLPSYGARYPTPTGHPNAGSPLLYHKILSQHPWEAKQHSYAFMALKLQQRKLRREIWKDTCILKPSALIKQVPFLSTQQTPTTFSEATNLLCPHSQRGCFLTWHFQANTLAPGENRSRCLEEAQLHLNYDSKLISMFQTFHWMQNTCQRTLQQALSHSRTGTHKRKALFSLSPPFERLTPW